MPTIIRSRQAGFTLIEIMVVVVILGILAALIVPNVMGKAGQAKITTTRATLAQVSGALKSFKLDQNRYPSTAEGLEALINKPANARSWPEGGYLPKVPKDGWDNDVQYAAPGSNGRPYDVYSWGADGEEGGEEENADIYADQ